MRKITGIVRDNNKLPLQNANVCIAYFNGAILYDKGQPQCTSTNKQGSYSITLPDEFKELKVSYVGFKDNFVDVNDYLTTNDGNINFSMDVSDNALDAFTITQSKPDGSKTKKVNWKRVGTVGGGLAVASLAVFLIVKSMKK
jgi:hypothetical protein